MATVTLTPVWRLAPAAETLREHVRQIDARWGKLFDRALQMAGSKSDFLEAKLLNQILGATAYTAPSPVFFGLWGTASSINDASNGGTAGEVSGGSYDRVSMTNNTTNFPNATGTSPSTKNNGVAITFTTATANWNSGSNINQVGVLDGNAKTSGDNLLLWADLTTAKSVLLGDTAQFAVNAFSWTED